MLPPANLSALLLYGVVFALVVRLVVVWTYRLTLHPLARYPGPWLAKVSDAYGAYHNLLGQLHVVTAKGHRKYGPVFRQGPNKLVFNSAESLHRIYHAKHEVQKSFGYETLVPSPGAYSLLTSIDKNMHRFKRKILSYGFADTALKAFEPKMIHHVDIFIRELLRTADMSSNDDTNWSDPCNMSRYGRHLQYDIMGEFGFGQSFNLQTSPDNRFLIDAVAATSLKAGVTMQYPRIWSLQIEKLLLYRMMKIRAKYLKLMSALVQARVNADEKLQVDLFSHLVNAKDPETGKGFTQDELWAESRFLLIAGADTTSTALAGCFFYLTAYPECYTKLAEEIRGTFTSAKDINGSPELYKCHYLRACIDEVMRMSAPVSSLLWREVLEGGITCEGRHIPAGVDIAVSPYTIHHNEDIFPDHHVFRPERWIESEHNPPEAVARARYAFSPFSLGTRSCPGRNMAYLELSNTLARTIWYTDFRRAPGKLGTVGEGIGNSGVDGRHVQKEFQLMEHVTSNHDGPYLQFRPRKGCIEQLFSADKV